MERRCLLTHRPFTVSEHEQEFCRVHQIPLPVLHPRERQRQLLMFRNRPYLYRSQCAHSGKAIFSAYAPELRRNVYDIDVWESDAWDPLSYGRDYDFTRSFFDQIWELMADVPWPNLTMNRPTLENCDYTNGIDHCKNCYLLFGASFDEDCLFSRFVNHSSHVADSVLAFKCELCYDCFDIHSCYNLKCSESCHNCSDSAFLFSCIGCRNCYGCVNLVGKEYHFFNQPLTREEYQARIAALDFQSREQLQSLRAEFERFRQQFPRKYQVGQRDENCTGNFISNSKGCRDCRFITNGEDLEHCIWLNEAKSSFFHVGFGQGSELIYNSMSVGSGAFNVKFCVECFPGVHDLEYCLWMTHAANNCFGCVGLKRHSYCVFNKQYSREEYGALVRRIKAQMLRNGEYGQFFPFDFAPHYYNRCEANDFFPLSKAEAARRGLSWFEEPATGEITSTSVPDRLSELAVDASGARCGATFCCAESGRGFKLIEPELELYQKLAVPPPDVAPLRRLANKNRFLDVGELTRVTCSECQQPLQSVYSTSMPGVLCEACFQQSLV